jgi:hypothetical protein
MKVYIANYQPEKLGGGWSFARNFIKGMGDVITTNYNEANIYFITSPSMVQRHEVEQAKTDGKKVILRIDNIVRNSRNRNTGMSRMRDFTDWADAVIYQSVAVRKLLSPFTGKEGTVILNSTDEDIFSLGSGKEREPFSFLYSRQNRDETKNFEVARAYFTEIYQAYPEEARITFVGQYSRELIDGNFDFYSGERFMFMGSVADPYTMADIYRNHRHLIYPYWNDACSNTLIEALMCGCSIVFPDEYYRRGSANEIMVLFELYGREYFSLKRMCDEYREVMEGLSVK